MTPPAILLPSQADQLYWMGRYLERALCRVVLMLDMQATFEPADPVWAQLPAVFADQAVFQAAQPCLVADFYRQPGIHAVPGMVTQMRDNARILRPILPEMMWEQLTRLCADPETSPRSYAALRDGLLALAGMADRLLRRDESWLFLRLGQLLERADQTIYLCQLVPPADASARADWVRRLPRLLGAPARMDCLTLLASRDSPSSPIFAFMRAETLLRRLPHLELAEECRHGAAASIDTLPGWLTAQQRRLELVHTGILKLLGGLSADNDDLRHRA